MLFQAVIKYLSSTNFFKILSKRLKVQFDKFVFSNFWQKLKKQIEKKGSKTTPKALVWIWSIIQQNVRSFLSRVKEMIILTNLTHTAVNDHGY